MKKSLFLIGTITLLGTGAVFALTNGTTAKGTAKTTMCEPDCCTIPTGNCTPTGCCDRAIGCD